MAILWGIEPLPFCWRKDGELVQGLTSMSSGFAPCTPPAVNSLIRGRTELGKGAPPACSQAA